MGATPPVAPKTNRRLIGRALSYYNVLFAISFNVDSAGCVANLTTRTLMYS